MFCFKRDATHLRLFINSSNSDFNGHMPDAHKSAKEKTKTKNGDKNHGVIVNLGLLKLDKKNTNMCMIIMLKNEQTRERKKKM